MSKPIPFKIDHLHIYATNPDETEKWLVEKVGAALIRRGAIGGFPTTWIDVGGVTLLLRGAKPGEKLDPAGPRPFGTDHFGIAVDDLDEAAAEFKRRGVQFEVDPRPAQPGMRIAFIIGPDNVRIEVVEHRPV